MDRITHRYRDTLSKKIYPYALRAATSYGKHCTSLIVFEVQTTWQNTILRGENIFLLKLLKTMFLAFN